jgi:hypothetical protein
VLDSTRNLSEIAYFQGQSSDLRDQQAERFGTKFISQRRSAIAAAAFSDNLKQHVLFSFDSTPRR